MAKLLYSAAMSLDGFIAGPGGDMSWLTPFMGPDQTVDDVIAATGAILAGSHTFLGDDPLKGQPGEGEVFGGGWSGPQFVLTHHPPAEPVAGVTFVTDLPSAIAQSKAAAGDKYVNVLGANVARQCLAAGELDEILVWFVPILLGDGVRLFDWPGGKRVKLEQVRAVASPQAVTLWLRVVR